MSRLPTDRLHEGTSRCRGPLGDDQAMTCPRPTHRANHTGFEDFPSETGRKRHDGLIELVEARDSLARRTHDATLPRMREHSRRALLAPTPALFQRSVFRGHFRAVNGWRSMGSQRGEG